MNARVWYAASYPYVLRSRRARDARELRAFYDRAARDAWVAAPLGDREFFAREAVLYRDTTKTERVRVRFHDGEVTI